MPQTYTRYIIHVYEDDVDWSTGLRSSLVTQTGLNPIGGLRETVFNLEEGLQN